MSKLVLWSGGCDSTLCLLDALKEHKKQQQEATSADAKKKLELKPVWALSISHSACGGYRYERDARKKIRAALQSRGFDFKHTEITVKSRGSFHGEQRGLVQPLFWLSMMLVYARNSDDIVMGYIKEDCIWHYRDRFMWAFSYLKDINDLEGSLVMPLEWTPKHQVLTRLKKAGLLKLCWWCENPTDAGRPCHECLCCRDHQDACRKAFGK